MPEKFALKKINVEGFECVCCPCQEADSILYLIYPAIVPFEEEWIQRMSKTHGVTMAAVYVPAEQWNDALTPWPEPGEAKGCPPFAGKSAQFLKLLQEKIIPQVETACEFNHPDHRDLMGVSLGGLFTLWQWMECDTFRSIASLSGSFWYVGFIEWFNQQKIPSKTGKAYFLLGLEEPHAHVEAFQSVGVNTERVVARLEAAHIPVTFEWVPGNHFSRPVHRAERALAALYPQKS